MKGDNYIDNEIALFKPDGKGGYVQPDSPPVPLADGYTIEVLGARTSDKGMRQLRELSRIQRHWSPLLNAWHEHYGHYLCRHGVPLDEFLWCINDYCYPDPSEPAAWQHETVFMLDDGFHGKDYCIVAEFTPRLLMFTWCVDSDGFVPYPAPELAS